MTRVDRALQILAMTFALTQAVACSKSEPPPPPPKAPPPAVAPAPAPPPPAAESHPAPPPVPAAVPFAVSGVDLGRQIGSDKSVSAPTTVFDKGDTIYASVRSVGKSPAITIKARWTYGPDGQLVTEQTENIAPTGPATTEFHIAKASGWPTGKYKVEISVDGQPATMREFEVK